MLLKFFKINNYLKDPKFGHCAKGKRPRYEYWGPMSLFDSVSYNNLFKSLS